MKVSVFLIFTKRVRLIFDLYVSLTFGSSTFKERFDDMIWFPRRISELDKAQRVLLYGADLDADHPVEKYSLELLLFFIDLSYDDT